MKKIFSSDISIGVFLTLFTLGAFFLHPSFFESLELKTYDLRMLLRQSAVPSSDIAIVAIDDDSIAKLGRWPWPRSLVADGITALQDAGARVIGLNILFTEPERNQGLVEIRALKETLPPLLTARNTLRIKEQVLSQLTSAELRLDNDSKLFQVLQRSRNVVLPMYFAIGSSAGAEEQVLSSHTITQVEGDAGTAIEGHHPSVPLAIFAEQSPGIGHVNQVPDIDGSIRAGLPAIRFQGDFYPAFAVQIVRQYLGLPMENLTLVPGQSLALGKTTVPLDASGRMLINYYGPVGTFPYFSFFDVINQKIDASALKDKIVLVGHMATGIADLNVTPPGNNFPGIEITATAIQNILQKNFIVRPAWAEKAELGILLFIGLFIAFLLPRLKAFPGAIAAMILFAGIAGGSTYFFVKMGYWLKIFSPSFLLITGYLIITSKRFLVTEKKKELVEAGAIETNKMLGLSFQGQGMLDLAFEKFRKCPIDENMKELLYNLGLDFERKRQFNKAVAVYEHVATADPKYKGIGERIPQLKAASDGAVFGGPMKKGASEGTVILEGASAAKPTLGRYEIIRELGRGAMGTVYLGKDPKINRMVAIKTLRFDDDVNEAAVKSVKERFFREAESAGNLNHPNIIKIYDAGDDNEVSYIAMELLEGEDLKKFTVKQNLLPLPVALDYAVKIADALDYAHQQGVVHRDIKPANIMVLKDGKLRITDFGIARITATSKTQTGTVLGTPSYMSPEQLVGKKVDGRSDLFSFGVMLYELLTGEKPFEGESIAELLYKIANEKQPNAKEKNPALPDGIVPVIDKLMAKNPDERYQRGADAAHDLQECLRTIQP